MSKKFKIENGIEMPPLRVRGSQEALVEALSQLDVGQSIFVAAEVCKTPAPYVARVAKASGAKFTTRKAEQKEVLGHRIWRFA
jgi:lysophospholipid acyltransferase (LPLAT)-like uncharacterized protein